MIIRIKSLIKSLLRYLRKKKYQGNSVVCLICRSEFRVFAPHGATHRRNAKCHTCGSLERHRLFWKYLNEKTNFNSLVNARVLHFAPERVFYRIFSDLHNILYIPCDLSPERYPHKGGAKIEKVDITSIPYEDNYFDVILCSHVLEHIPDDRRAMAELNRVMKPNGWGIFQVPIDYNRKLTYEDFSITTPEARKKAFGQWDHVRWYGNDYKDRLANAGFVVNEDHYVESFSKDEVRKYGFIHNELIYFCSKIKGN